MDGENLSSLHLEVDFESGFTVGLNRHVQSSRRFPTHTDVDPGTGPGLAIKETLSRFLLACLLISQSSL